MSMKIYGFGPSRSFRVLWAAEEAGIDYEYIEMKFGSAEKNGNYNKDYLKLNPQGKVPSIVDGDFVLTESAAIVNYIARKANNGLIPQDNPQAIAQYDEVCYFILAELEQPLWNQGKHTFALPEEYRVEQLKEKTTAYEFDKAQKTLSKIIEGRKFVAGDQFTMADVLFSQTVSWAKAFKFDVHADLLARSKGLIQRPAFIRAKEVIEAHAN